ncbi:MMPL family transporter [Geminisphaera colitermitum]|uniref:MMPL family transporter n=1 Tax=Geminisphaera colitermitum TaxID=1148786 RepID=UPI000158CBC1|nr:MMPL family transporter [Geminisphaera colitermitum]
MSRPSLISLERLQPWLAAGWLLFCILTAMTLVRLVPGARIDTNILSLLASGGQPRDTDINAACARRVEQQLLWLVSAPPGNPSETAPAQWWFEQLSLLSELTPPSGLLTDDYQTAWARHHHRHRAQLLDTRSLQRLEQGPDSWAAWVLSQVYSPLAGVGSAELAADPLLLVRSAQLAALGDASAFQLNQGWLTCTDPDGRPWRLIRSTLRGSSFDTGTIHSLTGRLDALETEFQQRWPGAQILRRGALYYSDYASRQAEREIALLGAISTLGITFVSWLLFRSFRPILLTVLSTAIGLAAGLAGVLLLFGNIHVITLVLATSIIGVSEDYAVHYLVERMRHGREETPAGSLRRLLRVLLLAVLTSSAAYMVLFVAPFPGFRQLAVCAILGLVCAFGTVVCWFPLLTKKICGHDKNAAFNALLASWLRLWRDNRLLRIGLPALLAVVGLASVLTLRIDDDVSLLQGFPPSFRENEQRIAALTAQDADTRWFLVRGATAEQTLQRLEALEPHLLEEQRAGRIRSARLLTRSLPSLARQRAAHDALAASAPSILDRLREAGLEPPPASGVIPPFDPLTPEAWFASPVSEGWRLLWFPDLAATFAAIVPVSGAAPGFDPPAIAARVEGVTWQDRRAEVSETFGTFRSHLGLLLAGSLAVIALVFVVRFGPRHGIRSLLPLLIAVGVALAPLAFLGNPFNLFGMFALILVVGIGVDYALFFSNPACDPDTAMLSILTATLTTLIGFGALALSGTPAISSFGLVLATGIATALILSPLARPSS